jgi:hypothetical protein
MSEREALGIWPHPPLGFDELVTFLAPIVEEQGFFPIVWEEHKDGEIVSEDIVIEKNQSDEFVVRSRRHHPTNPTILAEESENRFQNPKDACAFYLRWALYLPGDLDGWKVEE